MTTPKSNITSLKPITCQAILATGVPTFCADFRAFVERVSGVELSYLWDPIPPELAPEVAASLGYLTWFEDHGFLETEKVGFDPAQVRCVVDGANAVRIYYENCALGKITKQGFYRFESTITERLPVRCEDYKIHIQN